MNEWRGEHDGMTVFIVLAGLFLLAVGIGRFIHVGGSDRDD
ncbi:MAG: hypothetical protein V8Q88_09685 [Christensenellales bacterium]